MKAEELPEIKQPKTIEDCFTILKEIMVETEITMFKNYLEGNAIAVTHYTLGKFLRNNWNLWWNENVIEIYKDKGYLQEKPIIVKYFNEVLNIKHPDHMSDLILRSFHRHLNDEPLNIEAQVKHLTDFEKNHMDL